MKNIRLHLTVLVLVVISEFIGTFAFKVGIGTIVLLPMLYALILGILTTLKKVKISGEKEIKDAGSLISITLMLLMAKYGTTIGPSKSKSGSYFTGIWKFRNGSFRCSYCRITRP